MREKEEEMISRRRKYFVASLIVMDAGRRHRPHPQHSFHHATSRSSHRDQLFTSFISLVVFLFLLIVVLLLSPHVHGQEHELMQQHDDEMTPELTYTGWDQETEDTIEDRMDPGSRNRSFKLPVPRVKRIEKNRKVTTRKPAKSSHVVPKKNVQYELMSAEEVRDLHGLLTGREIVIKKKKSLKFPKGEETIHMTRRGSGLDRQQRPRQPRQLTFVRVSSRVHSDCPWCEVSVANSGSSGSESRYRPVIAHDSAYSDSSVSPDEDDFDRQVRFVIPEEVPVIRLAASPRKLRHFQTRTNNGAPVRNRAPVSPSPSVEYATGTHQPAHPHEQQPEYQPPHVLVHEPEREPEAPVAIVTHGQQEPLEMVYYKHFPSQPSEPAPGPEEQAAPEDQANEENDGPAAVVPQDERHAHFLKSTIEYEKQVLKEKRPIIKSKHPLLKHFPKFFAYLDQEDGLDQVPEESEDTPRKRPPSPQLDGVYGKEAKEGEQHVPPPAAAAEEERSPGGEAILIHPAHAVRPAVPAIMPPPLPPHVPLDLPPHPLAMDPELYPHPHPHPHDRIPKHHYNPQLSKRRPLLLPSLRLGLRLAMPLRRPPYPPPHHYRHPHHKIPTSMLNQIPEPDYKGFDPLPRKLGSKVADRFYSANIVQDIGLVYAPKSLLTVKFENGAQLCLGNPLSVLDSFTMPALSWSPVRSSMQHPYSRPMQPLYTAIMLDPDIPLMDGQYVHWLRVNIPSPRKKGTTIVKYINPLPIIPAFGSIASPNHRYVFLVFAQTKLLNPGKVKDYVSSRSTSFNLREFVKNFALETQPVAGNFFFGRLYVKTKTIC